MMDMHGTVQYLVQYCSVPVRIGTVQYYTVYHSTLFVRYRAWWYCTMQAASQVSGSDYIISV